MAKETPNYKFKKPDVNDFYDVNVQNGNWDEVDSQMKKMIPCVAAYYNGDKNVDDVIEPFVLITVSSSVNPELFKIVGGTFAWVWTNFYIGMSTANRRMQLAMSYNSGDSKMAFRIKGSSGWTEWRELAIANKVPSLDANGKILKGQLPELYGYGTDDLTPGASELETGKLYFVYE